MLYVVLIPLLLACLIPFISKMKHNIHTGIPVLLIPSAIFIYFIRFVGTNFEPMRQSYNWIPSLGINFDFYLDGLSLLFALLISGIGALVVLYSIYYLDSQERLGHFYVYLLMFMSAMLGIVLSDNIFVLYTFWELTSISSFLLIGYWHFNEKSRYGALKSLLITVLGGLSMFGGFILLSVMTGTSSIQIMIQNAEVIMNSPYMPLALGFILLGAFTKSAQFPFHIWLPDAMEAPTPVSAYLHSATMVKAGLFLVARFSPIFAGFEWFFIIVSIAGIVTLCWGSYMAVHQTDLKAILAFSTISQLGMIMAMLGFGTKLAIFAAVFHILCHATFKGSLFMVAGIVDHEAGTRDIRNLGGLMTLMPMSAALALFGTFSMAGIPLPFLNGFYSKELFFKSTLKLPEGTHVITTFLVEVIPYLAVFGSIFTFVYSLYFLFGTFGGQKQLDKLPKRPHEAPVGMLIAPLVLVLGVIIIGLFPNAFNGAFIAHAAESVAGTEVIKEITFWHGFGSTAFQMSLVVVAAGILLVSTRRKWSMIYSFVPGRASANHIYDAAIAQLDNGSRHINTFIMTGSLRRYMAIILGTVFLITFGFMLATGGFTIDFSNLADVTITEIAVVLVIIAAAVGTIFTKHNLGAILVAGVVGYGVSLLFVIYRAPDLALTQLVVETISVALFLLCFYHLPKLRNEKPQVRTRWINGTVSIGFGALMTLIGISAHSSDWFSSISDYFLETSHSLGGGDNVVNVILVDMRGLDTLFEITVLGIAALAIYSLIKLKNNRGAK
ncbi:Na+/H+ antiporter subunit A [Lentibacillus halophilus]|uniref:Na+/H+ antiporter subunit A n=1 Tax=Lentibacillus halophilus TaxID=295065 RepID=A0ABP3J5U8_9BACI